MTVESISTSTGPYTANGVTTSFPFDFAAASTDEIMIDAVPPIVGGYTVTIGDDRTGSVDYAAPPATGTVVNLYSAPYFRQEVQLENQGRAQLSIIDETADRSVIRDLLLLEIARRTIRVPRGQTLAELAGSRPGKFLAFDGNGNPILSSGTGADSGLRADLAGNGGAALVRTTSGGTVQDYINTSGSTSVASIAEMVAIASPVPNQIVTVSGYYTRGDGGGGAFQWSSAATAAPDLGTIFQSAAGGTGRWTRMVDDGVTLRDFGAKLDNSTDDSGSIQAAINYGCANRTTIFCPAGLAKVATGLTIPALSAGIVNLVGDPGFILVAGTNNMTVITVMYDYSRYGWSSWTGINIDGGTATGVTGVQFSGADALLYRRIADMRVSNCLYGIRAANVQEITWENVLTISCTIGWVFISDPINGGVTAQTFNSCRAQQCVVGLFVKSDSVYGLGALHFNSFLCQGNSLAGMCFFGNTSGGGYIDDVLLNQCYWEDTTTSATSPQTFFGKAVVPCGLLADDARIFATGSALGEPSVDQTVQLFNMASLSVVGGTINGVGIDATDCSVHLDGGVRVGGRIDGVKTWAGATFKDAQFGNGIACLSGSYIFEKSSAVTNQYSGSYPQAPTVANNTSGVANALAWNAALGQVQRIAFTSTPSTSFAVNTSVITGVSTNSAIGDFVLFALRLQSSVIARYSLLPSGGSALMGPMVVTVGPTPRTVLLAGRVSAASTGGYNLSIASLGSSAPALDVAQIMIRYAPNGSTLDPLNQIARTGLFNSGFNIYESPTAPLSGFGNNGDQCFNTSATVGQPKGWTKAGGAWVSQGNL